MEIPSRLLAVYSIVYWGQRRSLQLQLQPKPATSLTAVCGATSGPEGRARIVTSRTICLPWLHGWHCRLPSVHCPLSTGFVEVSTVTSYHAAAVVGIRETIGSHSGAGSLLFIVLCCCLWSWRAWLLACPACACARDIIVSPPRSTVAAQLFVLPIFLLFLFLCHYARACCNLLLSINAVSFVTWILGLWESRSPNCRIIQNT